MNGLHIPGTPLVVDYWRIRNVPSRALYFLTHLHADHTSGLSSQWPYPIHCTPITARLLRRKFKIRPELIEELEVGEHHLLHVEGDRGRVSVSVTVLDANHCPGSAMFLFEGFFGRIFYTGDFRYSQEMAAIPAIAQCSAVDILYLDNTYCHPSCTFPSRTTAMDKIIRMIRENKDRITLIGLHTLGKEDLLVAIAKQLGVWVGVSPERYETLRLLEADNVFSTDVDRCFVRVLPFHVVLKTVVAESSEEESVLGILPTCIFTGENAPPFPSHPSLKVVPYSDHSSYDELVEFVGVVKPRSVRPIVSSSRCNLSFFDHLLDPTPMTTYKMPDNTAQLFSKKLSKHCHGNNSRPRPLTPPVARKSLNVNGRGHRKPAGGVSYLLISPNKQQSGCGQGEGESRDCHVTQSKGRETVDEEGGGEKNQLTSPLRCDLFYGNQRIRRTRKRALSASGYNIQTEREREKGGRGSGVRHLPSSVTQPVWVTKLRQWGVMVDEVGRGGGEVGAEMGRGGEVGKEVERGGREVGKEVGRGGGEVGGEVEGKAKRRSQQVIEHYFPQSSNLSNPDIPFDRFDRLLGLT